MAQYPGGPSDVTVTFAFAEGEPGLQTALSAVRTALREAGIPDAAFEARLLVRAAVGISKERLLTDAELVLSAGQRSTLESLVGRRLQREPIQYVVGSVEFYGRSFKVDQRVLIPRPETELIVDQVLAFAAERRSPNLRILDIGTGSGAIAITLAAELPGVSVTATDISSDALAVARENARAIAVDDRIEFVHCSLAEEVSGLFDVVVSNPPYVLAGFLSGQDVQPELSYEPRTALDGGTDGMSVYRPLIRGLGTILEQRGAAFIEIDPPVAAECVAEAKISLPGASVAVLTDLAGIERCLVIELQH
jgi:release factor glutamine methyltransferase